MATSSKSTQPESRPNSVLYAEFQSKLNKIAHWLFIYFTEELPFFDQRSQDYKLILLLTWAAEKTENFDQLSKTLKSKLRQIASYDLAYLTSNLSDQLLPLTQIIFSLKKGTSKEFALSSDGLATDIYPIFKINSELPAAEQNIPKQPAIIFQDFWLHPEHYEKHPIGSGDRKKLWGIKYKNSCQSRCIRDASWIYCQSRSETGNNFCSGLIRTRI